MPLAGVHIAVTLLVLAAVRKLLGIRFSNRTLLLGGLLGLLPDLDIPTAWVINFAFGTELYFHKVYANALIIPLLLFTAAILARYLKKEKAATLTLIVAVAYFAHIAMDCYFSIGLTASLLPGGEMLGICRNLADLHALIILDAVAVASLMLYFAYKAKAKSG